MIAALEKTRYRNFEQHKEKLLQRGFQLVHNDAATAWMMKRLENDHITVYQLKVYGMPISFTIPEGHLNVITQLAKNVG